MSLSLQTLALLPPKGRLPFGGQERWLGGAQEFRTGVSDSACVRVSGWWPLRESKADLFFFL